MKRFQFQLAGVRDYRRRQAEVEEVKLQSIAGERHALELESARVENEAADTRRSLMVTGSAESQDLVALDSYLRRLAGAKKSIAVKLESCLARIGLQQQAVVEARRRVRLIETLESRRFREWKISVDREQENLSAELYLARWKRT